jgi:hypothetical protein
MQTYEEGLLLAQMRTADRIAQCPSSEAKQTKFTRGEYLAF